MGYVELNRKNTEMLINKTDDAKLDKLKNNRYLIQIEMMSKYVDKNKPLLDIGIRDGAFLGLLEELGFSDLYGVDVYGRSIELLNSRGIDGEVADAQTLDLDKKFDTVMMSHVLEHCPNPDIVLGNVYNHMNDDGILFIEVPIELGDPNPTGKDAHYYNFHSMEDLLGFLSGKWEILDKFSSNVRLKVVARRVNNG